MTLSDLYMPLVTLFLGMLGFALLTRFMSQSMRIREIELMERRKERSREEDRLIRQEQRERDFGADGSIYGEAIENGSGPALAGDYFAISFNKGPDITAEEFGAAIRAATDLPGDLARLSGWQNDAPMQVLVHRARYENPLELIVIVTGAPFVVGTVIAWSRQINAAIQEIRRSQTETTAIQAGHGEVEARHKFGSALYDSLTSAIAEEDGRVRDEILERVSKVANVAAAHGLMSVTHTELAALDAKGNVIREIPSNGVPKELGN